MVTNDLNLTQINSINLQHNNFIKWYHVNTASSWREIEEREKESDRIHGERTTPPQAEKATVG